MKKVVILRDRFFGSDASLGTCLVYNGRDQIFKSESVERGWRNNENMVSCVPVGRYDLVLEKSPRFRKMLWELKGVPNRAECKFHSANYAKQLNGCIALGNNRADIDGDRVLDVTSSGATMKKFHDALEGETKCEVWIFDVPTLLNVAI